MRLQEGDREHFTFWQLTGHSPLRAGAARLRVVLGRRFQKRRDPVNEGPAFFSATHRTPWRGPSFRATQGAVGSAIPGLSLRGPLASLPRGGGLATTWGKQSQRIPIRNPRHSGLFGIWWDSTDATQRDPAADTRCRKATG